jgi:glycosyltransferase involved in cell wall biosynthesis
MTMHVSNWRIRDSLKPHGVDGQSLGGCDVQNFTHRWIKAPTKAVFDRLARARVDETNFISRAGAREVLGKSDGDSAKVIHNGLPELPSYPMSPVLDRVELLYVGAAGLRKRVDLLPLILRDVRRKIPDARLRIVGFDRASVPGLARTLTGLGLDSAVSFVGAVSSNELRAYYESADVLVVPSAYEGLPMVVLEAFQCGLACVATRVGGLAEVIEDGINGFLVEPDHPAAMADCCVRILSDPGLGTRMAKSGQQAVAANFSVGHSVDEYLALYDEILG